MEKETIWIISYYIITLRSPGVSGKRPHDVPEACKERILSKKGREYLSFPNGASHDAVCLFRERLEIMECKPGAGYPAELVTAVVGFLPGQRYFLYRLRRQCSYVVMR